MPARRSIFRWVPIAPLALLPALIACHGDSAPAPLGAAALAAVSTHPGAPREALARAVDALFTEKDGGETRALLVLHDGRIAAERYAPGYGPGTKLLGWSMSKSVTGMMVLMLVADGRLRLDQPAPIPAWQRQGEPRGEITLRQLLQMRSGLKHREVADPAWDADTVKMLFLDGRDDMAAYAEAQPLEAEPGKVWNYSTETGVILADIAARTLTDSADPAVRRAAVQQYLNARLIAPLGLKSLTAEYDAAGTLIGGSMIHMTARDWGRFGEFLRNGGAVRGAQIMPRAVLAEMTAPSPANPGYGMQLWLNRPQVDGHEELFPGQAPQSLFACIGHLGQYVIVSPSQHLTLVRLGKTDAADKARLRARLEAVVELFGAD
jgi:CubicO group peptidase (beta-lactamase class C family)